MDIWSLGVITYILCDSLAISASSVLFTVVYTFRVCAAVCVASHLSTTRTMRYCLRKSKPAPSTSPLRIGMPSRLMVPHPPRLHSLCDHSHDVLVAVCPAAKDLILKLLVVDPTKRLTAEAMMAHPWVARVLFLTSHICTT